MGSFEIRIAKSAESEFLAVPFPFRRQINQRILRLKRDPYPPGSDRDKEVGFCSFEVHGWRVLYSVNEETRTATIRAVLKP